MYRFCIACIVLIVLTILRQIHIIQLNSYNLDQQVLWYKKNFVSFVLNIFFLIAIVLFYEFNFIPAYFLIIISMIGLLIENMPRQQKKKLVFTSRIKRLIFICAILFLIFFIPFILKRDEKGINIIMFVTAIAPLIVFIAYLISLPIENSFRRKFMSEAHDLIKKHSDLYVIGITGSFGKTSVKYYLNRLLQEKYSVCITPESFNTPMGATLTIKNDLKNIDDIFICEMGARRLNDIKEICDIVSPNGCIITDVGNMHLDTFKNIENVLKTKFELVDAVYNKNSANSIILFNGDNDLIRTKSKEYESANVKKYFYGFNDNNDFYTSDIVANATGVSFKLNSKDKLFDAMTFETNLLGKYNIMNLVSAISYAYLLGVDLLNIKKSVKSIEPVPHRLQLLKGDINNLIIDDAYNSNPSGAKNACDVLKTFDNYVKVIITPGMVELYDKQDYENEKFAEYAGSVCDYAIVVGHTNKLALDRGFAKTMQKENIIDIEKVEDAISYARNNIMGKKVILLENDLSDNY